MNPISARRQAKNDDRDNARVFMFGGVVALLVLLAALLYVFTADRRSEAPLQESTPAAMQPAPQSAPAPAPEAPAR